MKFTLKDYQEDAVKDVLERLKKARKRWHEDGDKNAFSLTATTGAGKTVMAAAVFEALFFGNDDFDFEPDRGAVVIWFSDDPSLNTQSRWRLTEASDLLTLDSLVEVGSSFNRDKLEAGKVYFLNTQKLGKNSLLVRGHSPNDPSVETMFGERVMPDGRSYTMWDTIQNTIDDPGLTLYLVLDEAHRGMKASGRADDKPTIVRQLINGTGGIEGVPVVWGISATVQRFNDAITGMEGRDTLSNVVVDAAKVQASGLLKDTINLDIPDEAGNFATVLIRRATDKLRDITKAWAEYAKAQNNVTTVLPLMVLQVPNAPDPKDIGTWLDTIFEQWPELPRDSLANVFGEHREESFGAHTVPYIEPERVQESSWVRVLVAKDAISTGWDCPRAEVMVSLRAASDQTNITQLLGRMVRTPLARRIPGNERLNAVDCLLPYFNRDTVKAVVAVLMNGGDDGAQLPGRRVLINPRDMLPNPAIPKEAWDALLALPSQTLPKRQARPVKRLTSLAHELAADALILDAGKNAHAEMHKVLDGLRVRYAEELKAARADVLEVEGETVRANIATQGMSFDKFVEVADYAVIEDAYRRAGRIISPDLARTYSEHLSRSAPAGVDPEDALLDAHTAVAALGLVPAIKEDLDASAEKLANQWLETYRVAIKALSDERQDVYREIREMSANPLNVDLARPHTWLQATIVRLADGTEMPLPRFERHLLCDTTDAKYPAELNGWERKVMVVELQRPGVIAWYRNPSRSSQDSLGIVYEDGNRTSILRPDFVFFTKLPDGRVVADIVDPHGDQFGDALPKLRGLAAYAEANAGAVRRVEAVAAIGDDFRVLDLTEKRVRDGVRRASSARELYISEVASDYFG